MPLIPSDGVDFLLKVNTGTAETPVWTVIGGQRGATLSLTAEQIDASNKQSGAWKTSVPGMMSWSIDADAVMLTDASGLSIDAGRAKLLTVFANRELVHVRYVRKDGSKFQGYAAITDLSEESPHDGVATYKITLAGAGAPEEVNGTKQVETAEVAGSVTTAGNAIFTVTAAGMTGSPKAISVAVALNDSAAVVAQKAREVLGADSAVTAKFSVGGYGTMVELTALTAVANDNTLNVAIANGTCAGLTASPTSENTTAGVAPAA